MPQVTLAEDTFRRLFEATLPRSIFPSTTLSHRRWTTRRDRPPSASEPPLPLTGEAWRAELEAWKRDAESRAGRTLPGFVLDDSRETIYRERDDARL